MDVLFQSKQGVAPTPLPRGERGGGVVKGLSGASLDNGGGQRPPLSLCNNEGRRPADLISVAQLTPRSGRPISGRVARAVKPPVRARVHDVNVVHDVVRRGMGHGLQLQSQMRSTWDISGGCQSPVPFEMNGAPRVLRAGRYVRGQGLPHSLILTVRCRKCAWCLGRRRNLWAFRGQVEIAASPRTWFGTLTMGPTEHALMRYRASSRLWRGGTDIELLSAREQFEELCKEFGSEVTLWLKRLRKKIKGKLRYLLVFERHKSGLPHAHILLHDMDAEHPIRHAALTAEWKMGFTKFKLCEALKTAWYVAKYLSKSAEARVRASLGYGKVQPCSNIAADEVWPRETPATPATSKPSQHGGSNLQLEVSEYDDHHTSLSQAGLLSKPANLSSAVAAPSAAAEAPPSAVRGPEAEGPSSARAPSPSGPQAAYAFIASVASLWPDAEAWQSVGAKRPVLLRLVSRSGVLSS